MLQFYWIIRTYNDGVWTTATYTVTSRVLEIVNELQEFGIEYKLRCIVLSTGG
jgi:hypothetical protein